MPLKTENTAIQHHPGTWGNGQSIYETAILTVAWMKQKGVDWDDPREKVIALFGNPTSGMRSRLSLPLRYDWRSTNQWCRNYSSVCHISHLYDTDRLWIRIRMKTKIRTYRLVCVCAWKRRHCYFYLSPWSCIENDKLKCAVCLIVARGLTIIV